MVLAKLGNGDARQSVTKPQRMVWSVQDLDRGFRMKVGADFCGKDKLEFKSGSKGEVFQARQRL